MTLPASLSLPHHPRLPPATGPGRSSGRRASRRLRRRRRRRPRGRGSSHGRGKRRRRRPPPDIEPGNESPCFGWVVICRHVWICAAAGFVLATCLEHGCLVLRSSLAGWAGIGGLAIGLYMKRRIAAFVNVFQWGMLLDCS